jgi:alpha-tubulin suppressor-like RCC1 family protein/cation transport regulator ChaC
MFVRLISNIVRFLRTTSAPLVVVADRKSCQILARPSTTTSTSMVKELLRKSSLAIFLFASFCHFQNVCVTNLAMAMASRSSRSHAGKGGHSPVWCEEKQIYIGGVPENTEEVRTLLDESDGHLRIFGYGSLCWSPGTGALSKPGVTTNLGRVRYKRVWAQRSTDHRGTVGFPGIVCTLLSDHEVEEIRTSASKTQPSFLSTYSDGIHNGKDHGPPIPSMTEGVVFNIPPELVQECLEELDFREKGGYARDVCDVLEEGNSQQRTVKALLYRGTPDNPAFSPRALLDLPFAAAIMAVAAGPSGKNDVYLNSLDSFLEETHTVAAQNDDTKFLASMVRTLQQHHQLHFLCGGGSNQHNQLLLNRPHNAAYLVGEDAHDRKEIVLSTFRHMTVDGTNGDDSVSDHGSMPDRPTRIFAGGGHSGLLLESGRLLLWGWNESCQCGRLSSNVEDEKDMVIPNLEPLSDILVEQAAFGFAHTLVVEKGTGKLFAFGGNERGQVTGRVPSDGITAVSTPATPKFLEDDQVVAVAAGLFHSAVITSQGELVVFGCNRFGQSLTTGASSDDRQSLYAAGRWTPPGAKCRHVACGQRHTVVCDDKNRLWTFGDNKHGQLGRITEGKKDPTPAVVSILEGTIPEGVPTKVHCGWSHTIVEYQLSNGDIIVYGFGRNDKGQLGTGNNEHVPIPKRLFLDRKVQLLECGSESTMVVDTDGILLGCGWNEHGNLGRGDQSDCLSLSRANGVKVSTPPDISVGPSSLALAVGGAHYIIGSVVATSTKST